MVTLKRASKLTISNATKGAQISALKRDSPKGFLETHVVALLSQLKMYVKIDVEDDWIFDWAETIIEDYWHLRLDEVILALKKGATKKQYGSVLLSDIIGWINDYELLREKHHIDRNLAFKENYDSSRNSETSLKKYIKNHTK